MHIVNARNLSHTVDNVFQMLQVRDVEDDINIGFPIGGSGFNIADIGLAVADHGSDLLQHPEAVVAINR